VLVPISACRPKQQVRALVVSVLLAAVIPPEAAFGQG
jgi:hypothetical protein